jgi:hypothetical protein
MRSSGDGVRSLLHRTRLQRPRLPTPSQPCTPQPAPCCVAGTKRELAHSLCGRGGVRIRAARQHGTPAMAACSPEHTLPTARPPSCMAHPVAHTSSRDTSPTAVAAELPLRTHPPPPSACMQAQTSGMLLLLCRTLWRRSLVQLHNPHPPIHRIAAAPTTSPFPRPFSTAHTSQTTSHPRTPCPWREREPPALACTWETPLRQRHPCTQAATCLHCRHSRLAALPPPPPPPQPYSLLSCNARRTPQRNVSQIACELLLCRSDGGAD